MPERQRDMGEEQVRIPRFFWGLFVAVFSALFFTVSALLFVDCVPAMSSCTYPYGLGALALLGFGVISLIGSLFLMLSATPESVHRAFSSWNQADTWGPTSPTTPAQPPPMAGPASEGADSARSSGP